MENEVLPQEDETSPVENNRGGRTMSKGKGIVLAVAAAGAYLITNMGYFMMAESNVLRDLREERAPLVLAGRNINQYREIETHLSEEGLVESERRRSLYDELEVKLEPVLRHIYGRALEKNTRMLTPIVAFFIEGGEGREEHVDKLFKAYQERLRSHFFDTENEPIDIDGRLHKYPVMDPF